jgi:tRNA-splicing ligase RtcB
MTAAPIHRWVAGPLPADVQHSLERVARAPDEREMHGVWFDVRVADALRDEAPSAYKDIGAVMRAQRELTQVVQRVRPLLSFEAA